MQCPSCASETFTYITRWIPAPERRQLPRPTTSKEAEVYRSLVAKDSPPPSTASTGRRVLKTGVVGLTALGLAGWLLRKKPDESGSQ